MMREIYIYSATYSQLATALDNLSHRRHECIVIPETMNKTYRNAIQCFYRTGRFDSRVSPCGTMRFIRKTRTTRKFSEAQL